MDGEIQYVADTFLLERTFQILAELEEGDGPLKKYAFDLTSVLGSIGNSIKTFVGGQIHGKDSGGAARTVVNFLTPAIFFRLHPLLGILVTAGQLFGLDLYSIYQRIVGVIKPSLESGQPVSAQQINDVAKASIPAEGAGAQVAATASNDFLYPLREFQDKGQLTKEAIRSNLSRTWQATPYVPNRNASPLIRMFSFLGPRRGGSLIVGILVWFLKTVLLSAGLLAVGGMAASALGAKPSQPAQTTQAPTPTTPAGTAAPPAQPTISITPTGAGGYNYRPKKGDIWVENLAGQQPHERLVQWAIESYPDLYQYQDIIVRTPSFWNVVRTLSQNWRPGQQQLVIPEPYKTRDEILKLFIPDVIRMLNQQRGMR
jgi:hypothetical protein